MLQNLTKGKMVEWVVLLVALVALGLSIAAVAKPCSSNFANFCEGGGCDSTAYTRRCDPNEIPSKTCKHDAIIKDQCHCNPDSGPPTCTPKGHYCQNDKECCSNTKCINNVCGDCADDTEACQDKPCCPGFHCKDGICIDHTTPPSSLDPLCNSATTKDDCQHPCVWSFEQGVCLKSELPSGKSRSSHRDECEEKYGDECSLDGEHPYYSCCKREKIYDKNNYEIKKIFIICLLITSFLSFSLMLSF